MNNCMDKIKNRIENIRDNIYDYNLKIMFSNVDSLILEISNCINLKEMPKDKVNILNTILQNINISIQNKDYQLVSDILKFQLKDFIENI
ncbi:hypothetical protein [Clostridium arbusti]|uniref:hypothetical protein n=1 Tax=Clostridium arbusti TaxID=1137848 RepID=UPI00028818F1|nr:hypothetical protein [Clostridium arbusti]